MRRAGWAVWIAYDLPGSYEEMPPNLLDELKRDRRWCQGNLMNFRLFLAQGLHPAHRAVFMTGVMAYLSAPLWFLSLLLSTGLLAVQSLSVPKYFTQPYQLFPVWPEWHPQWAIELFSATATLLFLPKILSVVVIWAQGAKGFGGGGRLLASMLFELLFSAMLAPIRMLFHTQFVLTALLGIGVSWKSPPREDAQTTWGEALARHGLHTLLGLAWAGLVYWLNPTFLWWLAPVVGALIISIPLSVYSSRITLGRRLRRARLFLIPEEAVPPHELRWTRQGFRRAPEPPDFADAVVDPVVNAINCAAGMIRLRLPEASRHERLNLIRTALIKGPTALNSAQRNTLLGDPLALSQLHFQVWNSAEANPSWNTGRVQVSA
jgi:membrane glycosyltransferase